MLCVEFTFCQLFFFFGKKTRGRMRMCTLKFVGSPLCTQMRTSGIRRDCGVNYQSTHTQQKLFLLQVAGFLAASCRITYGKYICMPFSFFRKGRASSSSGSFIRSGHNLYTLFYCWKQVVWFIDHAFACVRIHTDQYLTRWSGYMLSLLSLNRVVMLEHLQRLRRLYLCSDHTSRRSSKTSDIESYISLCSFAIHGEIEISFT